MSYTKGNRMIRTLTFLLVASSLLSAETIVDVSPEHTDVQVKDISGAVIDQFTLDP